MILKRPEWMVWTFFVFGMVVACFSVVDADSGNDGVVHAAIYAQQNESAKDGGVDDKVFRETYKNVSRKAVSYLLEKGMADDGSFSKQISPAVTALCTSALLEHGVPATDPRIQKSLKYLEGQIKEDGGIYAQGSNLRNYETSVSLMCFNRANESGKYTQVIQKAIAFLKNIQWDEGESYTLDSTFYGGQGYGSHKRPDASNTSYFLDALNSVTEEDSEDNDEAFKKAAIFMSRCQNLPHPENNSAGWASKVSKEDWGGFAYTGVGEGESKAGETPEGGLRSYASMTYAGLKSFLYAGLKKDDVRVKAAMDWISRHYDLSQNPGVGQQGLFYYYHVFAKALDTYGEPTIKDAEGNEHNWRADLTMKLSKLQQEDGSWINPSDRWFEGDPNLVSAYSLLALSYCNPDELSGEANQK